MRLLKTGHTRDSQVPLRRDGTTTATHHRALRTMCPNAIRSGSSSCINSLKTALLSQSFHFGGEMPFPALEGGLKECNDRQTIAYRHENLAGPLQRQLTPVPALSGNSVATHSVSFPLLTSTPTWARNTDVSQKTAASGDDRRVHKLAIEGPLHLARVCPRVDTSSSYLKPFRPNILLLSLLALSLLSCKSILAQLSYLCAAKSPGWIKQGGEASYPNFGHSQYSLIGQDSHHRRSEVVHCNVRIQ